MSNNKQSSFEWAIYQLGKIDMLLRFGEIGVQKYNRLHEEITTKAKEMHKEEIMDAFQEGKWDGWQNHKLKINGKQYQLKDPSDYYNETYESNT